MDIFEFLDGTREVLTRCIAEERNGERHRHLRELERFCWEHWKSLPRSKVVFEFDLPCRINGTPIASRSKGVALAWVVLADAQFRLGGIRADWIFPAATARSSASNALHRAARDVERYSPTLAGVIRSIHYRNGYLVIDKSLNGVACTSHLLARVTSA